MGAGEAATAPEMLGCLGVSQLPFCLWVKTRDENFLSGTLCLARITQNNILGTAERTAEPDTLDHTGAEGTSSNFTESEEDTGEVN